MQTTAKHTLKHRITIALVACLLAMPATAAQPITTDSRIKTLVFSPNEVFAVTTHYGYQSNIEFGARETIETISLGDRVAWQISPAGRRLFIRAMEENAHTNMTVVTNLRAYQFDLRSSSADAVFGSEELTYVVRFYYPEESADGQPANPAMNFPQPAPLTVPAPAPAAMPTPTGNIPPAPTSGMNYRYTFSGSRTIAPVKIFDDGKTTFFKFPTTMNAIPQISVISAKGEALNLPTRKTSDGLVAVNAVAPRFSIRQSGEQVVVYNETGGGK
ncbi:MAG: TrbG/VirB9 family P-type conjugative transfer protein [Pseudomonadota bacterium]